MISILYVDDKIEFLDLVKLFMAKKGDFSINTCQSPFEALKAISTNKYDVIVSDYYMPGMDGLAFLRTIRDRGCKTPFIMCTGFGGDSEKDEALRAGADCYIIKGCDPGIFFETLSRAVITTVRDNGEKKDLDDFQQIQ